MSADKDAADVMERDWSIHNNNCDTNSETRKN